MQAAQHRVGQVGTMRRRGARKRRLGLRPPGPIFPGKRDPYTERGVRTLLATLDRRVGITGVQPHRFRHGARRLVATVGGSTVAAHPGHSCLDSARNRRGSRVRGTRGSQDMEEPHV